MGREGLVLRYCLTSGCCAAVASACAKACFSPGFIFQGLVQESQVLEYLVRAIFGLALLGANTVMLHYYVLALGASSSTIVPTVTNTAVNVLASSVLGVILFNEVLYTKWYLGALLSVIGLACVQYSVTPDEQHTKVE